MFHWWKQCYRSSADTLFSRSAVFDITSSTDWNDFLSKHFSLWGTGKSHRGLMPLHRNSSIVCVFISAGTRLLSRCLSINVYSGSLFRLSGVMPQLYAAFIRSMCNICLRYICFPCTTKAVYRLRAAAARSSCCAANSFVCLCDNYRVRVQHRSAAAVDRRYERNTGTARDRLTWKSTAHWNPFAVEQRNAPIWLDTRQVRARGNVVPTLRGKATNIASRNRYPASHEDLHAFLRAHLAEYLSERNMFRNKIAEKHETCVLVPYTLYEVLRFPRERERLFGSMVCTRNIRENALQLS
jgi:hypothetical protein